MDEVKSSYSSKTADGYNNEPGPTVTNDNTPDDNNSIDERVSRILHRLIPAAIVGSNDDAKVENEFVVRVLDPNKERSKRADFIDAKSRGCETDETRNLVGVQK